jgi:hypothetical protein
MEISCTARGLVAARTSTSSWSTPLLRSARFASPVPLRWAFAARARAGPCLTSLRVYHQLRNRPVCKLDQSVFYQTACLACPRGILRVLHGRFVDTVHGAYPPSAYHSAEAALDHPAPEVGDAAHACDTGRAHDGAFRCAGGAGRAAGGAALRAQRRRRRLVPKVRARRRTPRRPTQGREGGVGGGVVKGEGTRAGKGDGSVLERPGTRLRASECRAPTLALALSPSPYWDSCRY